MATSRILPEIDTSFGKIVERLLKSMGSRLDTNVGSIARTLAEAYAHEMAIYYGMLDLSHASGYLDTAEGGALDNVVAILGITRARAGRLTGHVELSRTSPAPEDIGIPVGFRIRGDSETETIPEVATSAEAVLRRGETRVVVAVQEVEYDPKLASVTPLINPGNLTVMPRPLLGVEAVTNPGPLRRSSEDESDAELRARARVALREGEAGTLESIAAAVRKEGVRQVTVREPQDGRAGVVEVVVGDPDFASSPATIKAVEEAIREVKPAGIRVRLLYAKTVYFQPRFAVEPADPRLDDAGFDRLRRGLLDEIVKFGARQPIGETIRRRRLEAALFNHPGVRDVGEIRMRTFTWGVDTAGQPALVPETAKRETGAQGDWELSSLETAVFDLDAKAPEILRMRPRTYRFTLIVAVPKEDRRSVDDMRAAIRDGISAYGVWLATLRTSQVNWVDLESKLKEKAGISELRRALVADETGLSSELTKARPFLLNDDARLEAGSVEVVKSV